MTSVAANGVSPAQRGLGFSIALVVVVFAALIALGASGAGLGLVFALVQAALLLAVLTQDWARRSIEKQGRLAVPALLFTAALLVQLTALTPIGGAANLPIWNDVGGPGSASINHEALVIEVVKLVGLGALFLCAAACGRDRERAWWALRGVVIAGLLFDLLSLSLHFFSPQSVFGYEITTGPERLAATLGGANSAGTVFGLLVLCAIAALLQHWRDAGRKTQIGVKQLDLFLRRAPLELASFILSAACLVMTASRTALAATLAALGVLIIWEAVAGGLRARTWILPLVLLLALMVVLGMTGDLVANRYMEAPRDVATRLLLFRSHWASFMASPWLGSGLGSFTDINRMVLTKSNFTDMLMVGAAHNVFLQWLEQAGVVASALMWLCLAWIIAQEILSFSQKVSIGVICRLAVCASVLVVIHGITDFGLEVPAIASLWTLLLGLGLGRIAGRRASERKTMATGVAEGGG